MYLKRRLLATAAVVAMAAVTIYGSTKQMSGVEENGSRLPWFGNKETIYFWYSDDTMTNFMNSAAVSFGEKEGVRVIPMLYSDGEYLEEINRVSLQGEHMPDAYVVSNDSLEKAYLAGLAYEIEDSQNICNSEYFPEAALSAVSYKDKLVGYPFYYETSALVYNETYLEEWARQQAEKELTGANEENFDEETGEPIQTEEPVTVDEATLAVKTQEYMANGIPGTVDAILSIADTFDLPENVESVLKWDVSDIFYNYWIVGNYMIVGGDAGDDSSNININNQEAVQCLETYKALNQFFSIEADTVTYDSVVQDFIDGKTVFTIGTTDIVSKLETAKADGSFTYEYGIAPMPKVSDELASRSLSVTNAVAVNGYSEHKELANRFAAYLTGEYAEDLYDRTGKVSANLKVNQDNGALQMFMQEYAGSVPLPKLLETGKFWIRLEILFSKVWNGEDVTTLVQELADQIVLQVDGTQ